MTRKQYSARFKAKVAMEAIRGSKPMNELAVRFGLHATQIAQWKKQALEGLPEIFANHRGQKGKEETLQASLYQQIGRLQMEVAWLKKNTDGPIGQRRRLNVREGLSLKKDREERR